ncbi:MAG: dihydrodipicolinate synthase family protein [Deinococcota bacterium]
MSLSGVVVPTLTPMDITGNKLNLDAVAQQVDFLILHRVGALFVNGTTGEGALLSTTERKDHAERVISTVAKRIPVVVQIGTLSTRESIELADHAAQAGADAVACISPSFFAYSQAELEQHYLAIARAVSPLDFYLYNIPARTGNTLSADLAERLSQEDNIVGIKDSSGNLAQILDYLAVPNLDVLPGADLLATQALLAGAKGIVAGPAGVFPEPYMAFWAAWQAKDHAHLLYWQNILMQLSHLIAHGGRLDILKALAALRLPGLGTVRSPLAAIQADELEHLRHSLKEVLSTTHLSEEAYNWL